MTPTQFLLLGLVLLTFALFVLYTKHKAANDNRPMPWRTVALYAALAGFVALFVFSEPLFRAVVYAVFGVDERIIGPNASSAQVAADHVIGGWVQIGTLLSKLFAAISFYITSYTLPWLLQRATHPEPTRWAKESYSNEFLGLTPAERFENYGRIQFNQSLRIAASFLAAALLV